MRYTSKKMMKQRYVVVIDGSSGAGKSTLAKRLSKKLGYVYLDTGALYRCIALAAYMKEVPVKNSLKLYQLAKASSIHFKNGRLRQQVFLNGVEVSQKIRAPYISLLASQYSGLPLVRKALLYHQRTFAKAGGLVAEGRDLGTVVFPKADIKFFLTANIKERAKRRYKELKNRHQHISLSRIEKEIKQRDKADTQRTHAPLRKAKDAILIDTTSHSIDQLLLRMYRIIQSKVKL